MYKYIVSCFLVVVFFLDVLRTLDKLHFYVEYLKVRVLGEFQAAQHIYNSLSQKQLVNIQGVQEQI